MITDNLVVHKTQLIQVPRVRMMSELTDEQIRKVAPSVFAAAPWQGNANRVGMSEKYRFIPTVEVMDGLRDSGFYPVRAQQSRTRIEGKAEFTRHMLRFRLRGQDSPSSVGDIIPEIILTNSHDGTAAYNLMFGLFRLACLNGLVVADAQFTTIRARHSGPASLIEEVLRGSLGMFEQAPQIINRVKEFQAIELSHDEQIAYSRAALPLLDSSIDIRPDSLMQARRREDAPAEGLWRCGSRSLWKTYNTVQENAIKGGASGRTTSGRHSSLRAVKSVDRDLKLNKALWMLTEHMAALKKGLNGDVSPLVKIN